MNKQKRYVFFERLQKQNPKPTTELVFSSSFELLIAVILSAQATDISVNKATIKLFKTANQPKNLFELGVQKLKTYIKNIGLYNTKAENIIKTCEIIYKKFDSKIPSTREDLESLPGVGRKTANVVLNTAFKQPVMAVDTHIFRVSNRTGLAIGKNVLEVEEKLLHNVPKKFLLDAHHWLILHGRYICKARNPLCDTCIISDLCDFRIKQKKIIK